MTNTELTQSPLRQGWQDLKIKHVIRRTYSGGTPPSGNDDYYTASDSGTSWMMISDLTRAPYVTYTKKRLTKAGLQAKPLAMVPSGTVVYAMYASVGAVATTAIDTTMNQAIIGLEPHPEKCLPRFLHLYLESIRPQVFVYTKSSTQANLNAATVLSLPLSLPTVEEQHLVVRYLDNAELRIQRAISVKRRLIHLLNEQKTSQVSKLLLGEPNADTWHGVLPEDWEQLPARSLFVERRQNNSPNLQMLSVTISAGVLLQEDLLKKHGAKKDQSNQDRSKYKVVKPGDIVYNKMRAWQGAAGVSKYLGIVSPAYIVQTPRTNKILSEYAGLVMRTPQFAKEAERWSYGITSDQWSLRPQHFRSIAFPVPPLEAQQQLVQLAETITQGYDRAVEAIESEITLLNEYRTRLISDVVTGRKDIRKQAAAMQDVDPAELQALYGAATEIEDGEEADE